MKRSIKANRALKSLVRTVDAFGTVAIRSSEELNAHFADIRWRNGVKCPYCNRRKLYHLSNGEHHKCAHCKRRFSIKVGTIFEGSKLSIGDWVEAIHWLTSDTEKKTSVALAERLGITQKSAWSMIDLLLRASKTPSFNRKLPILRSAKPRPIERHLPAAVQETLVKLTQGINLSTGLDHPGDESRAQHALGKLIALGIKLNPKAIKRWALNHSWDKHSAAQLETVVRQCNRDALRASESNPRSDEASETSSENVTKATPIEPESSPKRPKISAAAWAAAAKASLRPPAIRPPGAKLRL